MSIIKKMRKQVAVHWPVTGINSSGEPVYGEAYEISCRWEDVAEQFVDPSGNDAVSQSRVYVDRDMAPGDVLWLGTMDGLVSQTDPFKNPGAYAIRKFDKIPNLKNTETLRMAVL